MLILPTALAVALKAPLTHGWGLIKICVRPRRPPPDEGEYEWVRLVLVQPRSLSLPLRAEASHRVCLEWRWERTGEVEDMLGGRSESWQKQMRRAKLKRHWSKSQKWQGRITTVQALFKCFAKIMLMHSAVTKTYGLGKHFLGAFCKSNFTFHNF